MCPKENTFFEEIKNEKNDNNKKILKRKFQSYREIVGIYRLNTFGFIYV